MEDKQLTTKESIDLISKMIENTRRNFTGNGGSMFLIWGYTTILVTVGILALLLATRNSNVMWFWWALPIIGAVLSWRHYRKHQKPIQTHLDKAINYVWLVFSIAFVACSIFSFATSSCQINILFTIALMVGMATAITGLIIKFKPVAIGGFMGIAMSFFLLFYIGIWQLPVFAVIFLAAQVIPGHMLNRAYKKRRRGDV